MFTKNRNLVIVRIVFVVALLAGVFEFDPVRANAKTSNESASVVDYSVVDGNSPQNSELLSLAPDIISTASPEYLVTGSNNSRALFGFSVNSAGDVSGDGFDDVIIGARDYWDGQGGEGAAFLYFGSSSGEFNNPNWSVQSNQKFAAMGRSVDAAGDVNGDGYDDILVGASQYTIDQQSEGAVFAYYGSPSGPNTTPDWIGQMDQVSGTFGWSVSTAGDVNNDGYDDVIVGARYYANGQTREGKAFLYLGSVTGLASTPAWSKEIDIENAGFGYSVSEAGDTNGDGYDDVLITSWNYIYGQLNGGKAYVFLGEPGGLSDTASWIGESGLMMDGYGNVGTTAGDVNGDGYSDILVGAPGDDTENQIEGKAYLYFGSDSGPSPQPDWVVQDGTTRTRFGSSLASAGDYNNDGYDDILVGDDIYYVSQSIAGAVFLYLGGASGPSTSPYTSYTNGVNNSAFGSAVGSAGHFNDDMYDDFLVGAPMWTSAPYSGGRALMFFGQCTFNSITVINADDSGTGSLRQAIADICPGGTITFDTSLSGQTIALASTLSIGKDITIDGSSLSSNIKLDGASSLPILVGIGNENLITIKNIDFSNAQYGINHSFGALQVINSSFSGNDTGIQSETQLTITNTSFSENATGIVNFGVLQVEDSSFSNNGRGIYNEEVFDLSLPGDATIVRSSFTQNYQGGIKNQNGTLTVTNSSFTNNTSEYGGGIENNGTSSVSNSQFTNNTVTQVGGGIFNSGNLTLTTSTFTGNNSGENGGGIYSSGGMEAVSSTFSGNTAVNLGGGISVVGGVDLQMTNSTFDNNSASQGGGVYFDAESYYAPSVLKNNTIASNPGGGLYINNGNLELFSNILANSIIGSDCFAGSTVIIMSNNNLIKNNSTSPNSCGTSAITSDPFLGPLQDNGGFTQTMALGAGSPAIDAGDDANCPATD